GNAVPQAHFKFRWIISRNFPSWLKAERSLHPYRLTHPWRKLRRGKLPHHEPICHNSFARGGGPNSGLQKDRARRRSAGNQGEFDPVAENVRRIKVRLCVCLGRGGAQANPSRAARRGIDGYFPSAHVG